MDDTLKRELQYRVAQAWLSDDRLWKDNVEAGVDGETIREWRRRCQESYRASDVFDFLHRRLDLMIWSLEHLPQVFGEVDASILKKGRDPRPGVA